MDISSVQQLTGLSDACMMIVSVYIIFIYRESSHELHLYKLHRFCKIILFVYGLPPILDKLLG